nr:MAG TPA: hypothetical protein [Caudoviricetes sp.]
MRGMVSGCLWMKQGRQPENRAGKRQPPRP